MLKLFIILSAILYTEEYVNSSLTIKNCELCNYQTCMYNYTNDTLVLNKCICNSTILCGDSCRGRNISRNDIENCLEKGVFCLNFYILNGLGIFGDASLGLISFIFVCLITIVLLAYLFFNYSKIKTYFRKPEESIENESLLEDIDEPVTTNHINRTIKLTSHVVTAIIFFSLIFIIFLISFIVCHILIRNTSISGNEYNCV